MTKNTINQTQLKNSDGWQLCPQTPTYVGGTGILFTGTTIDNTISEGMKLKLTNDGTVKYYTITAFATAGSDRAMILNGPVALVSGAITNVYFSTEFMPLSFNSIPFEISGVYPSFYNQPAQTGTAGSSYNYTANLPRTILSGEAVMLLPVAAKWCTVELISTSDTQFTFTLNCVTSTTLMKSIWSVIYYKTH